MKNVGITNVIYISYFKVMWYRMQHRLNFQFEKHIKETLLVLYTYMISRRISYLYRYGKGYNTEYDKFHWIKLYYFSTISLTKDVCATSRCQSTDKYGWHVRLIIGWPEIGKRQHCPTLKFLGEKNGQTSKT